jgi:hypothetical protein
MSNVIAIALAAILSVERVAVVICVLVTTVVLLVRFKHGESL